MTSTTGFNWSAVIAGAAVATATSLFLITLGLGFGLALTPLSGATAFLTLGAIWVLAAQAFGFAAGGHVTGRIIGPAVETNREEEWRAGLHGLTMWAITVAATLTMVALLAAAGRPLHGPAPRAESGIAAYWADILLAPLDDHAMARGEDLSHDKEEAARVLAASLHPGAPAAAESRADLLRLTVMDAGISRAEAAERLNFVESHMRGELDAARKAAAYAALWTGLALLFGAIVAVAAAISARWQDDRLQFPWTIQRRPV